MSKKSVTLLLPPELVARVDAWAKSRKRSRNMAVELLLDEALAGYPHLAPPAETAARRLPPARGERMAAQLTAAVPHAPAPHAETYALPVGAQAPAPGSRLKGQRK